MVIGIIEDDNLLRKALDTSLKNQGYTTILVGSRKEAIKNIDSSVDLLIVDIGLPDGDGINLYQELQKNGRIPAIFLTAKDPSGIYINMDWKTKEYYRNKIKRISEKTKISRKDNKTNLSSSQIIQWVLAEEHGNKGKTAKRLGISRSTLWRMLKK